MKREVLLGATAEKELVFAKVSYERNYFNVCFSVVSPVEVTDEYLEERVESQIDCYDKEGLYDLCEHYDCKPSELHQEMVTASSVEDIIDISYFAPSFSFDHLEGDIYFEIIAGGQCGDSYEVTKHCYGYPLIDHIMSHWKLYHLESLEEDKVDNIFRFIDDVIMDNYFEHEEDWVKRWLLTDVFPVEE